MAMANSSYIKQIKDDTGSEDEYGMFLIPLGDNTWYPTSPAGPTMFGYKGTEHEDLVKEFFNFVTTTESLQEILDNSPAYTNLDVNDDNLEQHWLPEEEEFLETVDKDKNECICTSEWYKIYKRLLDAVLVRIWLHSARAKWKQMTFLQIWTPTVQRLPRQLAMQTGTK
ncbi:MAG: hypothetical protein ACLU6Y_00635 [Ruminococcus sp.]